jgi:hypothetical protein
MTVIFSLLALSHSSAAGTSRKTSIQKRVGATAALRKSTNDKSQRSKTLRASATKDCAPCAAKVAQTKKARPTGKRAKIAKQLPCHPKNYVNPRIARNYTAALWDIKRAGITPRITSVWRSSANQEQLHRCSLSTRCRRSNPGLYRALPAGKSIHEAGFAVDMAGIATGPRGAKRITPRGRRIVAIMKKHDFNWRYGLRDPVHFEADPRKYGYRSVKQAIKRTQTTCQIKLAKSKANKKTPNNVAAGRARPRLLPAAISTKTRRLAGKATA